MIDSSNISDILKECEDAKEPELYYKGLNGAYNKNVDYDRQIESFAQDMLKRIEKMLTYLIGRSL